ncbi:transposase [Nocardia vinacea]|nr:transposase [Nocardia vinacea]
MGRDLADEGLSTYTHVTDQDTTYGTKIIVATKREAHHVLDEILGNATDLSITEYATDTHGLTLVNFGCSTCSGYSCRPASAIWAASPVPAGFAVRGGVAVSTPRDRC